MIKNTSPTEKIPTNQVYSFVAIPINAIQTNTDGNTSNPINIQNLLLKTLPDGRLQLLNQVSQKRPKKLYSKLAICSFRALQRRP